MTPTERLDKFNMHHKKIAEIIVGCIGVESRQVHWREVAPMIAAYVNSEHDKARNQAIQDCIEEVKKEWGKYTYPRNQDVPFGDVILILEALKTIS